MFHFLSIIASVFYNVNCFLLFSYFINHTRLESLEKNTFDKPYQIRFFPVLFIFCNMILLLFPSMLQRSS